VSLLSSQRYRSRGRRLGIDPTTLERAVATIERIQRSDPRLTPILTLRHLSELTGAQYGYLRRVVGRILGGYRHVHFKTRIPGRSLPARLGCSSDLTALRRASRSSTVISEASCSDNFHPVLLARLKEQLSCSRVACLDHASRSTPAEATTFLAHAVQLLNPAHGFDLRAGGSIIPPWQPSFGGRGG